MDAADGHVAAGDGSPERMKSAGAFSLDLVLALLVGGLGAIVGTRYVMIPAVAASSQYYQQDLLTPALLFACGRGLTNASELADTTAPPGRAVTTFLVRASERFDCSTLPPSIETAGLTSFQSASRYLLFAVGSTWRLAGISWTALAPIFGLMFGVVTAGAYLLFRFAANRPIAVVATTVFASAGSQIGNLPHLRDYAKAPFFVMTLLIVAQVVTRRLSPLALIGWAAVMGAWIGVGFGVRFDVAPYLLFFVVAMVVFSPGSLRSEWRIRAAAAVTACVVFLIVASPILRAFALGNNSWHVILLGLSSAHDVGLGLRESLYQSGPLYSDSHVSVVVNAYWGRLHQTASPLRLDTPEYAAAGAAYYREIARLFPADLLTRAWAAVLQVLQFPFLPYSYSVPLGVESPSVIAWFVGRARVFEFFRWLAPWVPLAVIVAIGRTERRHAILIAGTICSFGAYASLQFQGRHVFPLEIMTVWLFTAAVQGVLGAVRMPRSGGRWFAVDRSSMSKWPRTLAFGGAALVLIVIAPVASLRAYQTRQVSTLLARYESAPRSSITSSLMPVDSGRVRFPAVSSKDDHSSSAVPSGLFLAEFGGPSCDYDSVDATIAYSASALPLDFSRVVHVPIPQRADEVTRVFVTGYGPPADPRGPQYEFIGLEVPASKTGCVRRFSRIRETSTRLLVDAVLPPDWRSAHLYQTIAAWEPPDGRGSPRTSVFPVGADVRRSQLARPIEPLHSMPEYLASIASIDEPGRLSVNGWPRRPAVYLSSWPVAPASADDVLVATGEVGRGSFTIGLVRDDRWVAVVPVDQAGPFRVVIQPPGDGRYGVVVANGNRVSWSRLAIDRIGWVRDASDPAR
jgi:hypothetical protein